MDQVIEADRVVEFERVDTDHLRQSLDLREIASEYTTLRKHTAVELCGPCPKCGGDDRFGAKSDFFYCRHCKVGGDVIQFKMWAEGVLFLEAVEMLKGNMPTVVKKVESVISLSSPKKWDAGARGRGLSSMQDRLFSDGCPGADYLLSRGLQPETWIAYGLGYNSRVSLPWADPFTERSAICIPWYRNGALKAIVNRFLEPHTYTNKDGKVVENFKLKNEPGSDLRGYFFGGQVGINPCADRTLIVTEGEVNAMSVFQATIGGVYDVFSIGTEGKPITPNMAAAAARYGLVIAWLDKRDRATEKAVALGAGSITSPGGRDANDLLVAGLLSEFLDAARAKIIGEL